MVCGNGVYAVLPAADRKSGNFLTVLTHHNINAGQVRHKIIRVNGPGALLFIIACRDRFRYIFIMESKRIINGEIC